MGGQTTRVGIGAFEGSLFSANAFLLLCVAAAMMQIDCRKWNAFNGYQHVRTETGSNQGQNMALTALCVPSFANGIRGVLVLGKGIPPVVRRRRDDADRLPTQSTFRTQRFAAACPWNHVSLRHLVRGTRAVFISKNSKHINPVQENLRNRTKSFVVSK